jgi:Rab proteins geranylgeranyltransferase component A
VADAVQCLMEAVDAENPPTVLWQMYYTQNGDDPSTAEAVSQPDSSEVGASRTLMFPRLSLDLAFDGAVLERVREVWKKIMGDEAGSFMVFEDREGAAAEDDE